MWGDVVVSDSSLTQAVRTLRRALEDDPKNPAFIRTHARYGYQFVHPDAVEEDERGPVPTEESATGESVARGTAARGATARGTAAGEATARDTAAGGEPPSAAGDPFESTIGTLLSGARSEDERREAAETLHALGTAEALRRLDARPGHEAARAFLRDARWDVAGAGPVPLVGAPGGFAAARILIAMRLRRAARAAASRWTAASAGGAIAGAFAGFLGGVAIRLGPGSSASPSLPATLAFVGAVVGGLGAAGAGAGLAIAEAAARSFRGAALVACGAAGGGAIGALAHLVGRWTLEGMFGHDLSPVGGGLEGIAIGGAAGLGYALSTPRPGGGMATPHGRARLAAAAATGVACAAAGVALSAFGGHLVTASLNLIARTFEGSQVGVAPVARLLGERELGPLTRTVLSAYEGFFFGFGLALGLTHRPGARK